MDRLQLQKLRDLPIEGVAERLGIRVSNRHKALCPFHDDHHASLSFHPGRNTCRCFACMDGAMGTIDLVMRHLGKDFVEACRWLAEGSSIILTSPCPAGRQAQEKEARPFDAARYERFFERPWLSDEAQQFLYHERRLDPRVVRWCRLTSWRDREGNHWLQTPYYDAEWRLIGVQHRRLAPLPQPAGGAPDRQPGDVTQQAPRFRFPPGSRTGIYNLPVLKRLRPADELWIAEGCSDCWAMLSSGHKAIAIPSATLLRPADAAPLTRLVREGWTGSFHMCPDRDVPGERLFLRLSEVLPGLVRHPLPPGCKDYADYYVKQKNSD